MIFNKMRSLSRLHRCAVVVVLFTISFFYHERSKGLNSTLHHTWQGTVYRIVVFGDDWSDTGNYRVSLPSQASTIARHPEQGKLWTEILCTEVSQVLIQEIHI